MLFFCRVDGLDLKKKKKVSTNEKYLPDIAFVGQIIGSEKKKVSTNKKYLLFVSKKQR